MNRKYAIVEFFGKRELEGLSNLRHMISNVEVHVKFELSTYNTLPTAEILSGKNVRAWV